MGHWSCPASYVPFFKTLVVFTACLLLTYTQASVIRVKRDGANPSLSVLLSDVHHDIYTGSNKEDGDSHLRNQVDRISPDPVQAIEPAPAPDPVPAPDLAQKPEPAKAPEPVQPPEQDPVKVPQFDPIQVPDIPQVDLAGGLNSEPQQQGPDKSQNEDGDGNGNHGVIDKPSVDSQAPQEKPQPQEQQQEQQQQQQPEQQQQEQQQPQQEEPPKPQVITTPEPPPPPDTPEPISPSDLAADLRSAAADQIPEDDDSSEEETRPRENLVDPFIITPDVGAGEGSPDPVEGDPSAPAPPPVPKYNDPFDPFIHPKHPPPPPPPTDFGGSINIGPMGGPPPPPPVSGFMPPPPPPSGNHYIPPPPPPAYVLHHKSYAPMSRIAENRRHPNPPPIFSSHAGPAYEPVAHEKKPAAPSENLTPSEKLAAERSAQAEAHSLALDKQSDFLDMRQDQLANMPHHENPTAPSLASTVPTTPAMSAADIKSAAVDKAADALDRQRDLAAVIREKEAAAREAVIAARESIPGTV